MRAAKFQVLVLPDKPVWRPVEDGAMENDWRIVDVAFYPKETKGTGDKTRAGKKKQDAFLYLCRAKYQGSTVIGQVRPGRTETCRFGYGGVAYGSARYEVLAEIVEP